MRQNTLFLLPTVLGACLLLAACGDRDAQAPADAATAAATPADDATDAAAGAEATDADATRRRLTPKRIAEIRATGNTGLWSDVSQVCPGTHPRAMIGWNVEASGADAVAVYLIGTSGDERLFAQGGPVGEKSTGAWLRPGMAFQVRAKADARELAALEIAQGQDCAKQ